MREILLKLKGKRGLAKGSNQDWKLVADRVNVKNIRLSWITNTDQSVWMLTPSD